MDSTARFSDRVRDYVLYRPRYPRELVAELEKRGLSKSAPIADIGSGTGISTRLLIEAGYEVYAIEPNAAMRAAADHDLASFLAYHSIDGTAEATTLIDQLVGAVFAAQAFHWFDPPRARAEMKRVLREPRLVILVWNDRRIRGAFLEAYERLLFDHGIDYANVRHQDAASPEKIGAFFDGAPYEKIVLPNEQRFDRAGLVGRALSSSYVPQKGHAKHDAMMRALNELFDAHQDNGHVLFEYDTRAFVGRLA